MKKILLISFLLLLQFNSAYAGGKGESSFTLGVKHFKKQEYKSALKYFNKASALGMKKAALYFNLGVTQYKLQRYKQATVSFKKSSHTKTFKKIAYYNLGLVSEAQQQNKSAIIWYKKSIRYKGNKKLSLLAEKRIDRILNHKNGISSATFAAGYDDNITNAASNSPSNRGDNYMEVFAYTQAAINKNVSFKASAYLLNYSSYSSENFLLLNAAIDYTYRLKNWNITPEFGFYTSTLNSTGFQQTLDFKVSGKRYLKNNASLLLKYRYSNINSQNTAYNYLQGTRQQFRVDYKTKVNNKARLRLRYQLETNSRQNLTNANYSPTRHTFRARFKHALSNKWDLTEELSYRMSQYGAAASVIRNDKRLRLRFTASKVFAKKWSGGVRYSFTNNDSNISSEKYNRNKIQVFANLDF